MCGLVGAINGTSVVPFLLRGLRRLEYRGYDSAGIAIESADGPLVLRAEGKIANLEQALALSPLDGASGLGHTRWATHGKPSVANAHPHATRQVAVVHNGIIENYRELRAELTAAGHIFTSETDTEVVPRLLTHYLEAGHTPEAALERLIGRLEGAYALGILFAGEDSRLFAARRGSPLVIGRADGAAFLASDPLAFDSGIEEIVHLEDGDWAIVETGKTAIRDADGCHAQRKRQVLNTAARRPGKNGHRHFMHKEIHQQPDIIGEIFRTHVDRKSPAFEPPALGFGFESLTRLAIVACGTSYYAGAIAKYWFEKLAALPVDVEVASEFRYRHSPALENGGALFISQSGETADTLAALRHCRSQGVPTAVLLNTAESTMSREAGQVLNILAGPEIGVASTKAFTAQLALLAAMAIDAGRVRGALTPIAAARLADAFARLPALMACAVADESRYRNIAKAFEHTTSALFIGRGTSFPLALEGALKLKEISYIHAEGIGAGELKHGPIALLDENLPVIVIAPRDETFEKTLSNLREVRSRGAPVLLISDAQGIERAGGEYTWTLSMPECDPMLAPILYALPLQLLAYHVAARRGCDIDQPRNLAKAVTVE